MQRFYKILTEFDGLKIVFGEFIGSADSDEDANVLIQSYVDILEIGYREAVDLGRGT